MKSMILCIAAAVASVSVAEERYRFRERLAELHPNRLAAEAAPVSGDEVKIDGGWCIVIDGEDPVLGHAAEDLRDYFEKSMGVRIVPGAAAERTGTIRIGVKPEPNPLTSRIAVKGGEIAVTGATAREAFQGAIRLEELMNERGLPAVKRGERTFTRMFSPRMTHSGWEVEKFPDVYLDQLAHAGMDSILVFIKEPPDVTRNGREDMNALVERCRLRGIDVYAYCSFPDLAAFNPTDPGAEKRYEEIYGSIVRNAPGIRGIVCVGESVGFEPKDGTSSGYWWKRDDDNVPKKGLPRNGFYPTLEWVDWLELVKKVTRRYNRDLEIVFWTYNWYRQPEEARVALLEKIPTDITLHVTFEMGDDPVEKCGIKTSVWDYSITGPGPGRTFRSEAEVAKRRGIRLTSMSNTGGRTWDLGCSPYEPVPGLWFERFRNLRAAQAKWGLSGLMDCHHYGFQPNFIAELAKAAFTLENDEAALAAKLKAIAARDFGNGNADAVVSVWEDWTAAMRYHSAFHGDLAGPWRIGPAYPLVLPGEERPLPLKPVYEYYAGQRYGNGWKYLEGEYFIPEEELDGYIAMSELEVKGWEKGCGRLREILKRVPEGKRSFAERIAANGEYHLVSARTCLNCRRFLKAGRVYKDAKVSAADKATARAELLAVIAAERENVKAAIPVVDRDSALGWEPMMRYFGDRPNLEWKLKLLEDVRARLQSGR